MRLAEARIEGAERNLIIRYAAGSNAVEVQVCSAGWTDLQPPVMVWIADEDDAWDAARNAHLVCEGFEGSEGDAAEYYDLFQRARRF